MVAARRSPGPEAQKARFGRVTEPTDGLLEQAGRETARNGDLTVQTDHATTRAAGLTALSAHETQLVDLTALPECQSARTRGSAPRLESAQTLAC